MPIFHDHDESAQDGSPPPPRTPERWWERQRDDTAEAKPSHSEAFVSSFSSPRPLSREQLIERLKRRQSPPWSTQQSDEPRETTSSNESSPKLTVSQLLPAVELHKRQEATPEPSQSNYELGQEIERPRSALHRGDFRLQQQPSKSETATEILSTSPVAPWHRDFPHAATRPHQRQSSHSFAPSYGNVQPLHSRSRATSQSSLSNFVLMPPTSPLVHALNNPDLDTSRTNFRQSSRSPERNGRRHTFSPNSFHQFISSNDDRSATSTPIDRHLIGIKREATFPYQAHQPRRSLSTIPGLYSTSIPHTPQLRPRRPSITSESPLQHAAMVGSYEESILRGRMSTTPSRPLNFVAQIGVLGKGQCKSNLRCPPHVTVPFPAVFYSYNNNGSNRISEDSPSPYVGLIDLENSLPPPEEADKSRRRHRTAPSTSDNEQAGRPKETSDTRKMERRKKEKMKRRSTSPKAPPGGSYRIPQQGQLQIIIKNPNKTAVKLFLVPYDLSDMEPGQKTFIRQRSYSAGPIIDMPMSCRKNLGSDRPEAALSNSDDPNDRPVLRYLIHLHICCPSKGRYYLYKSVRVVFANRVPDDKERLRNEIQLPEPRYSSYKPTRDAATNPLGTSMAAATLASDKAMRRRSAGVPFMRNIMDSVDGLGQSPQTPPFLSLSQSAASFNSPMARPIPFNLPRLDTVESRPVSREKMDIDPQPSSQVFSFLPLTEPLRNSPISPIEALDASNTEEGYQKWTRGINGYSSSGHGSVAAPPAIGEGLLARRLRGLDVQHSPTLNPQPEGNP